MQPSAGELVQPRKRPLVTPAAVGEQTLQDFILVKGRYVRISPGDKNLLVLLGLRSTWAFGFTPEIGDTVSA